MIDERAGWPSRVDRIELRSGTFLIEYFDESDGRVTVQARGPVSPAATEPAAECYRIVAAADGSTEDAARVDLWKLLRALGEFEWATRVPPEER